MITRYKVTQGNYGKTIRATLVGADGQAVDLTAVDSLTFSAGDLTPVIDAETAFPDADQVANPGVATYTLQVGDTDVVGDYPAQFRATWSDRVLDFPTSPLILSVIATNGSGGGS